MMPAETSLLTRYGLREFHSAEPTCFRCVCEVLFVPRSSRCLVRIMMVWEGLSVNHIHHGTTATASTARGA